jgi:hypothetical protein
MAMAHSSLTNVFIPASTNNYTKGRNSKILKITPHHMAGNLSVEACGAMFQNPNRGGSSNYGIGNDGRVGLYVAEENRSWCSSNAANDHMAITIEVANSGGGPNWPVSDRALAKLVDLCADICRRYGIAKLNYTGTANGNLTQHNMFSSTLCPGPYLQSKFGWIAEQVNARLGSTIIAVSFMVKVTSPSLSIRRGPGINNAIAGTITDMGKYTIVELADGPGATKWGKLKSGAGWISLDFTDYSFTFQPYEVRIISDNLNIRTGPGTNHAITAQITNKGVYTIVEESSGPGAGMWGKLNSGAGWISLDFVSRIN